LRAEESLRPTNLENDASAQTFHRKGTLMRKIIRFLLLTLVSGIWAASVQAHDVTWWGNSLGTNATSPLMIYYGPGAFAYAEVEPENGEPCTVIVALNQDSSPSPLVSATILNNGLNTVKILISVLRDPVGSSEKATITGTWFATGYPPFNGCNGSGQISIPITVNSTAPRWDLMPVGPVGYPGAVGVWIKPGFNCALERAATPTGPWYNIGIGSNLYVFNDMATAFFGRKTTLAGYLTGQVTDSKGNPRTGWNLNFLVGGLPTVTDAAGSFNFNDRVPEGMNTLTASNPDGAELPIDIPTTDNTTFDWLIEEAADTNVVATNLCNCTPWAAIGFGYSSSGQTPVYYSGGANAPKTGANCGDISVTVTPPSGVAFPIVPGTTRRQNSGGNPASGIWSITTTVCGKSKTATIDVP
jgi:hypothetical protein